MRKKMYRNKEITVTSSDIDLSFISSILFDINMRNVDINMRYAIVFHIFYHSGNNILEDECLEYKIM